MGLANVDNTSDLNKPISTATQTALNLKADTTALATKANDADVVKLAGDQTVAGVKTFSAAPVVPDNSFTQAKVSGLTTDLATINTRLGRVDPGTAGTERQMLRISGGVPQWRDAPTFFSRDYVTPGTGDAYAGLTALFAAAHGGNGTGVHGAHVIIEPGEYRLSQTLELTQWSGIISGSGGGISPSYGTGTLNGRATVLRWNGPADQPMIRVRDSRDLIIQNLRLEGLDTAIPSYGIEFNNPGAAMAGTNEYLTVRDVHIGVYPWTTQGTHKGKVKTGIGFTGTNGNNDQFRIERVTIYQPTEYGLYIANTQSVGGTARNLVVNGPGVACVSTAATLRLDDPEFYSYPLGIETTNTAVVIVDNIKAELGDTLARLFYSSSLIIRGGQVQVQNVQTGSQVFIDATPSQQLRIALRDLNITGMTDATLNRIEIGGVSPYNGRYIIEVKNCIGITAQQLVMAAGTSMWAIDSKGIVEWQSIAPNGNFHQFRNELRHTSAGVGRQALNYTVWDTPIAGAA